MTLAGLRIGEMISLRWTDVDLARGTINVRRSKTPAGIRTIYLLPALRDHLDTLPRGDHLVFPTSLSLGASRRTPSWGSIIPGLQGWRDDLIRRRRPAVRALPRRGVGAARARRARAVREAVPRGVPERAGLDHDPAQARRVPRGVCGLRPRAGRAVRQARRRAPAR